jgi:hypothetical protein
MRIRGMTRTKMTPVRLLRRWAIQQEGRVHSHDLHRTGIMLGAIPPGANGLFGGQHPSMKSDGAYWIVTHTGYACDAQLRDD